MKNGVSEFVATERENKYPFSAFNFVVSINGETVAAFQEINGLNNENSPIEFREGPDGMNTVRKLPGIEKYSNLTLKHGLTSSIYLLGWCREVRDGSTAFPPVRDVTIQLQNEMHEFVYNWKLTNAWCSKLTGSALNAMGNEIAVETMELAYDRIEIE